MKKLIQIILLALILGVFPAALFAQTKGSISGTVIDFKDGSPLVGSIISLEGTNIKVGADENGKFVILKIEPGIYSLKATCIGYKYKINDSVLVITGKKTKINFQLVQGDLIEPYVIEFICCKIRGISNLALSVEGSGRTFEGDWFNEAIRK